MAIPRRLALVGTGLIGGSIGLALRRRGTRVEIAHSLEGRSGVLVLVVSARGADAFEEALVGHGYHVAWTALS